MLLEKGFDLYIQLTDVNGIVALVWFSDKKFAEIQIKSREPTARFPNKFADINYTKGRDGYWFAFRTWKDNKDTWWLLRAKEFENTAHHEKKGTWGITLNKDDPALRCILNKNSWNKFSQG